MVPPGQGPQADEEREFRLRVPADARYEQLARLAVTSVAARNGCPDAAVDELDVAVAQGFASLGTTTTTTITITTTVHDDAVDVELAPQPDGGTAPITLRAQR